MRKLWLALAALLLISTGALAQAQTRLIINGDLTWSRATFTLNGSSQTLLAATGAGGAARRGVIVVNPAANATAYVSVAGGTATSADIPIPAGSYFYVVGQIGAVNVLTVIGTNTQTLTVYTAP